MYYTISQIRSIICSIKTEIYESLQHVLYNRPRVFIRKYVNFVLLRRPRGRLRRNLNANYHASSRPLCLLLLRIVVIDFSENIKSGHYACVKYKPG